MTDKMISAEEFDRRFDSGEDMGDYIDWGSARPLVATDVGCSVHLPTNLAARIDAEATKQGVTRDALINVWLSDRLDRAA